MTCNSGYYHGVLQVALAGLPRNVVVKKAQRLCSAPAVNTEEFLLYQCVHGLGHGLMIYSGDDLPWSLRTCHKLLTDFDRVSCTGGVFMQNLDTTMGTSRYLSTKNPIYPCNTVAERDKVYCYLMVTSRINTLDGYNWRKTADWCRRSERGWVETCFESYGRDASGSSEYDPAKTIALCLEAGPNAGDCIYGAARDYGNNYAGGPAVVALLRGRAGAVPAALLRGHRDDPRRDAPLRRRAEGGVQPGDAGALPARLLPRRCDHVVLGDLAARASLWNRRRKLALFMETMRPGPETRVVDVGVGDTGFGTEPGVASSHNFFEALYPWPERITAVSDVPLPNFAREFPMVECVTASGTELPFEDDAFDVAFSNAVVEHVGGRGGAAAVRRRALPRGAARLPLDAEPLVPGRDAHALPFVHWLPRPAADRAFAAFGRDNWDRVELLSKRRLLGLFPPTVRPGSSSPGSRSASRQSG